MRDILIVEDGLHERERLNKLFCGARFTVSCAESAQEAERLLELDQFRLAVLDIGLGDKSGSVLFERVKHLPDPPYIIILTGNPSVHLKRRFLDDGAVAYIVKASDAATNEALLATVQGVLGTTPSPKQSGLPLIEFLRSYISESSRQLFLDDKNNLPPCRECNSIEYIVSFSHKTQIPPIIEGKVICSHCAKEMDPEVA